MEYSHLDAKLVDKPEKFNEQDSSLPDWRVSRRATHQRVFCVTCDLVFHVTCSRFKPSKRSVKPKMFLDQLGKVV